MDHGLSRELLTHFLYTKKFPTWVIIFLLPFLNFFSEKIDNYIRNLRLLKSKLVTINLASGAGDGIERFTRNGIYTSVAWYIQKNYSLQSAQYLVNSHVNVRPLHHSVSDIRPEYKVQSSDPIKITFQGEIIYLSFSEENRKDNTIHYICLQAYQRDTIDKFMTHAEQQYEEYLDTNTGAVQSYSYKNEWTPNPMYCEKTLDNIFIHPETMKTIKSQLDIWQKYSHVYRMRGIPYKRGFLFYGPTGCGKTTTSYAIATHLQFNIYKVHLRSYRSAIEFRSAIKEIPKRSVVLIEDIDCVSISHARSGMEQYTVSRDDLDDMPDSAFSYLQEQRRKEGTREYRGMDAEDAAEAIINENPEKHLPVLKEMGFAPKKGTSESLTLDVLLEVLDGNEYLYECIIIATTNLRDKLDPALIRGGRLDTHIEFAEADHSIIQSIFTAFYPEFTQYDKIPNIRMAQATLINSIIMPNIDNCPRALEILNEINHK
jgi:hypothetical protein